MPTLDTATIGDIGPSAIPDVAGDKQKALTLADLYDRNTLNKIEVGEAKTKQADMTYAKQILAGKDLSKLEDQNSAVSQITKRNPQLGMELARSFSTQRQDTAKEGMDQLDYYKAKNDIIGTDLLQLKARHDEILAQNPKATEQQIHDAMQKDVVAWVQRMSGQTLPNGQPLLNDQDKQLIKSGLSQGYSKAWVEQMVQRSAEGRQQIAAKLKERDEQRKEKATDAAITAGQRRGDQADRRLTDAEAKTKVMQTMKEGGQLDQEDAQFMAEQYIAGDKSVFVGLGRGAQGPQNILMVRHAIVKEAKAQGMKPQDLAAKLAEYQGYVSEQRTLGTQQANVEMASSEAQQMIANAKEASAAVPRASFMPWAKLSQMSETQLNDPALASLKAATQAVVNTWARAINPKGVATVADKEHGNALLSAAQDQDAYNAVLDRFQQETEASLAAPQSARGRLHDAFLSGGPAAAGPPGATPPATPGRGAAAPGAAAQIAPSGWGQATVVTP